MHNFFVEHQKDIKTQKWYLPERKHMYSQKNRDLDLFFDPFKLENEKLFHKAIDSIISLEKK